MSDHSTGSSASSTNSWTILSPEEAAVETVGPEDGTESLSGVPGLPEEGTGVLMESDVSVTDALAEPVLSEEGHQVCQETSPVICEAAAFVGPSFSGFDEEEFDPEIHAPVIHDTITSSPPDSDLLGSTPFAMTSEASMLFSEEPSFVPPSSDMFTDIGYGHESPMEEILAQESCTPEVLSEESMSPEESHTPEPFPQQNSAPEGLLRQSPSPEGLPEESPAPEVVALETVTPETLSPESSASEVPLDRSPSPDIPLPDVLEASAPEVLTQESSVSEPRSERSPTPEPVPIEVTPDVISAPALAAPAPEVVENLSLSMQGSPPAADTAPTPETRPVEGSPAPVSLEPETIPSASAQQEHEEEQEEPSLEVEVVEVPGRVEPVEAEPVEEVVRTDPAAEGDGLRLRHTMPTLGRSSEDEEEEEEEFQLAERREEKQGFSLNKLIVGALVLLCLGSLFFSDDGFDGSEMTEQELLERLAQENQQITMLEAQLQSQKEDLDQALRAEEAGAGALQKENAKLKDELSAMPGLREELESLRARVAELSQLTVRESETTPTSTDHGRTARPA
ncbi:flocculation protein FLO11 isoform X2 [Clupea harengus]|uniref:Flocculation protein FLO11 isoform X2 n=1 Tax=Clupea harengus TaxID=7950 RepID=A0A6P8H215_CLUHA|nr:flocculation protein FLO11 isoform X2 [Clupea harengus]